MTSHEPDGPNAAAPHAEEPEGWESSDSWQQLLKTISYGICTPFLGAGACHGVLPLGAEIALGWAKEHDYPFEDSHNLPRVSQFYAVQKGSLRPRLELRDRFEGRYPDFANPDEPHRVVAELGLPIYITTNYDDILTWTLHRLGREPIREYCRWHIARKDSDTMETEVGSVIRPTRERPVVFHLHGLFEDADSMVLTEDDYLNFLINISESENKIIPSYVEPAFGTKNAFLFIGYSLEDMSFKVLFRKFANQISRSSGDRHVAVQLHNTSKLTPDQKKRQRDFLQAQLESQKVKVYWGTAHQFARRLRREWVAFKLRKAQEALALQQAQEGVK
jgi:hypothetical protein